MESTSYRSMTLLNSLGDVTIIWSKDKDNEIKEMIRQKIAAGIRFFLVEKIPLLPLYYQKTVHDPSTLSERQVKLDDRQLEDLVLSGKVQISKVSNKTVEFIRATKDVEEIVTSSTVALPQMCGG